MKSSLKYLMVIGMTLYGSGDRIKAITPSTEMEERMIQTTISSLTINEYERQRTVFSQHGF